jgi:predicted HicB family RNase H-like nuclease
MAFARLEFIVYKAMILNHEGYIAEITYDDGDHEMHGHVINTRDVFHFSGRNIDELTQALAGTIADYRAWCAELGEESEKPYSGILGAL